jgi:predicted transcriptional regulator
MSGPGRKREVSDEEILRAIRLHADPVVTAREVADIVDMSSQGVNKRLRELVDQELIVRKEVGARAVIYWLSDAGRGRLSPSG